MTLTTKYDIGQNLFFIENSLIRKLPVEKITTISTREDGTCITYHLWDTNDNFRGMTMVCIEKKECDVFDSVENLTKYYTRLLG